MIGATVGAETPDENKMEVSLLGWVDFKKEVQNHKRCKDPETQECTYCGFIDCPEDEPMHYHHDGCPACDCVDPDDVNVGKSVGGSE